MHYAHAVRHGMRGGINRWVELRVQEGNGRRACDQPNGCAGGDAVFRGNGRGFNGPVDQWREESGGKRVIKARGRETDRAFLAIGMVLDVHLVLEQAELADEQRDDEQQPEQSVRPAGEPGVSLGHGRGGYTQLRLVGNREPGTLNFRTRHLPVVGRPSP